MKRVILAFGFSLIVSVASWAAPVSPKRAYAVAQHFYSAVAPTKAAQQLHLMEWTYSGIYLFVGQDGGFVMVAADDAARPILGYSTSGTFVPDSLSPALQQWLQGYQQQMEALRDAESRKLNTGIAEQWAALEQGIPTEGNLFASKDGNSLAPMLTTQWDQTHPFNGYCPRGTVAGCAAIAQAQLMNYWQYPRYGRGSHSYVHSRYGTLEADFEQAPYDWEHMPVNAQASNTEESRNAVATLVFHVGVSLEMDYASAAQGGSAAAGFVNMEGYPSINNSLKDYFRYRPDMRIASKIEGYSNDAWREMLIAELNEGRPVLYSGQSDAGGHAFICDGYDTRGYVHFNFGWSGVGDGFYPVDSISPGRGGAGGGSYTFNDFNMALLNVQPEYALYVGDTMLCFTREGAVDSLFVYLNDTCTSQLNISGVPDWLYLSENAIVRAGWLYLMASDNNTGQDRVAVITLSQGSEQRTVRVAQGGYSSEELCPLTIVMESTRGDEGWQGGAHLTLESASGYVYGTARLTAGTLDSVQLPVAPHDMYAVFHSGGGTDRYINYAIRNQHGETLVSVNYAYRNGGRHFIEWPCYHLGIDDQDTQGHQSTSRLYPNPTNGLLHIEAQDLQQVELMDMTGRRISTHRPTTKPSALTLNLNEQPRGAYFIRITTTGGTTVRRVVLQ